MLPWEAEAADRKAVGKGRDALYRGLCEAWDGAAAQARSIAEQHEAPVLEWVPAPHPLSISKRLGVLGKVAREFRYGSPEDFVHRFAMMLDWLVQDPWWHSSIRRTNSPNILDVIGTFSLFQTARASAKNVRSRIDGAIDDTLKDRARGNDGRVIDDADECDYSSLNMDEVRERQNQERLGSLNGDNTDSETSK